MFKVNNKNNRITSMTSNKLILNEWILARLIYKNQLLN